MQIVFRSVFREGPDRERATNNPANAPAFGQAGELPSLSPSERLEETDENMVFRQRVGGKTQNQEPFPLQELQHSEPRPRACSSKKKRS